MIGCHIYIKKKSGTIGKAILVQFLDNPMFIKPFLSYELNGDHNLVLAGLIPNGVFFFLSPGMSILILTFS